MAKKTYFSPAFFKFFRDLKENNNREWFQDHKARYEQVVRDPMLAFIADAQAPLTKISPHLVADPRANGGSMFRIYRDTRFSKDKTPYKTAAGVQFRHEQGKDVHAPGFYLHMEPGNAGKGNVGVGTGLWHPDGKTLAKVRDAIVADGQGWKKASRGKAFQDSAVKYKAKLWGESLKNPPRGYDPEHPFIEDLKRKDFIASVSLTQKDACGPDFMANFIEACRVQAPFTSYLTRAVGLPW